MKKLHLKTLLAAFCIPALLLSGLAACKNNSDDDDSPAASPEVAPGTVGEFPEEVLKAAELAKRLDSNDSHVILFWYDSSANYSDYTLWNWVAGDGDENKMVDFASDSASNIAYADFTAAYNRLTDEMKEALDTNKDFKFIIREKSAWNKKTGDEVFPLSAGKHAIYTKGDIYTISDNMKATISSATMETTTKMKVQLGVKYGLALSASDNGFKLTADDGSTIAISDIVNYNAQNNRFKNNTSTLLVTLSSPINTGKTWSLSHEKFGKATVATAAVVSQDLANIVYTGDDLGLTLSGNNATFKVWAPTASDVKVLLYASVNDVGTYNASSVSLKVPGALTDSELKGTPAGTIQMTKDSKTGVWTASKENCTEKYYKYQIVNGGKTYYVCDIYAKSASPDSIAAEIVDINSDSNANSSWESSYTNPFTGSKYNDAVIYEMHIRDWSRATNSSSTGKFTDFASDAVINHLKDLGVTHVQILPMFDYAQVNADENYNWGYNPYHYNVPEGRYTDYSTNSDGTAAVAQVREMVKKLHSAGIAVIMDVVFNHTSGTGAGSLYDSTVPYYYYRMKADGSYSNGSGCGNETNSEAPMFKKYMIDSLKHWMTDYHINGFRFDLMGLHSKDTMEEIGAELKKIDSKVLVYGEPWTGGDSLVSNSASSAGQNFGAFDDDFRDAIKGAEFGGFKAGHVQGTFEDSGITAGLKGVSGKNKRNETGITGHGINYVECHDNFTLYDKLVYCLNIDAAKTADSTGKIATVFPATVSASDLDIIKKQDKLAAAFVLLGQGMPFLNGGQEFLRTKKGNPDSYAADEKGGIKWTNTSGTYNIDDVNTIDLGMKTTNADVYNTYKGLIALRKSSKAFTEPTKITTKAKYDSKKGLTSYTVTDGASDSFEVYFNASKDDYTLSEDKKLNGKLVTISESDGSFTIASAAADVTSIPAQSFVILKK